MTAHISNLNIVRGHRPRLQSFLVVV